MKFKLYSNEIETVILSDGMNKAYMVRSKRRCVESQTACALTTKRSPNILIFWADYFQFTKYMPIFYLNNILSTRKQRRSGQIQVKASESVNNYRNRSVKQRYGRHFVNQARCASELFSFMGAVRAGWEGNDKGVTYGQEQQWS